MKNSKIIYFFLFFFISTNIYCYEFNLFTIKNKTYTSIDLKNRTEYLKMINMKNQTTDKIYEDFISAIIFNEYSKEKNIKIQNKDLDEYIKQINSNIFENNKDIITKNLKYDIKRKIILENLLKDKNIKIKDESSLNIYDITINYFLFDNNDLKEKRAKINLIDFNDIQETKINLKNYNIDYQFYLKEIKEISKIDKRIKMAIINNERKFNIKYDDFTIFGKIERKIKKEINPKLTFYQIFKDNKKKLKDINCVKIMDLIQKNKIKYKIFDNIEFDKINDSLREKLIIINDTISINHQNSESIIILCGINYNKKLLNEISYSNKLNEIVIAIEKDFIETQKINFNFIKYEK